MRKNLLFVAVLTAFVSVPVLAYTTVSELTEPESMINAGYSQSFAEDTFVMKNRANSKQIEPLYDRPNNIIIRTWKGFWAYLDPARDNIDKIHHDTNTAPSITDL